MSACLMGFVAVVEVRELNLPRNSSSWTGSSWKHPRWE